MDAPRKTLKPMEPPQARSMQRMAMPQPGTRWTGRAGGKQETRIVVDETLGGNVCYRLAARHYYASWQSEKCTLAEWCGWVEQTHARLRHSETKLSDAGGKP